MSVHTLKTEFFYQLPSMSYIDAKWEEPNLRAPASIPGNRRRGGLGAWVSRQIDSAMSWYRDSRAAQELSLMSDRELGDIGITRADVGRLFETRFNADLRERGATR